MHRTAVFIDRDGVINRKMPEGDYVKDWTEFYFLPGVIEALRILKEKKFLIIVVTNQRGVAKSIVPEKILNEIHEKMQEEIKGYGGAVDAVYFCPHETTDRCHCRKPEPGMILKAIRDFKNKGVEIDIENSYMIGDSESDIIAGKAVGLKTVKIGKYFGIADIMAERLMDFVKDMPFHKDFVQFRGH